MRGVTRNLTKEILLMDFIISDNVITNNTRSFTLFRREETDPDGK